MSVIDVFKLVLRICLLRAGPQDLPASHGWLAAGLTGYVAVSALNVLPVYGAGAAIAQAVVETVIMFVWIYGALMLVHRPQRLVQTLSAITLTGSFIGILLTPQLHVLFRAEANQSSAPFTSITYLLTVGWLLAIFGRIFHQALNLRQAWWGVIVALGMVLTSSLLIVGIFGNATTG